MPVFILGKKDPVPKNGIIIDTTSQSRTWSRGLSPFFLGPVEVAPGVISQNVENAWQFSKVYERHMEGISRVKDEYFNWAKSGFEDTYAHRYPMGKGAVPKYSIKILNVGILLYIVI